MFFLLCHNFGLAINNLKWRWVQKSYNQFRESKRFCSYLKQVLFVVRHCWKGGRIRFEADIAAYCAYYIASKYSNLCNCTGKIYEFRWIVLFSPWKTDLQKQYAFVYIILSGLIKIFKCRSVFAWILMKTNTSWTTRGSWLETRKHSCIRSWNYKMLKWMKRSMKQYVQHLMCPLSSTQSLSFIECLIGKSFILEQDFIGCYHWEAGVLVAMELNQWKWFGLCLFACMYGIAHRLGMVF